MTMSGVDATSRLVLDTSAYSHMRHGHDAELDAIAQAELVIVPTTVLGELAAAFESGSRKRENRTVLAQFLDRGLRRDPSCDRGCRAPLWNDPRRIAPRWNTDPRQRRLDRGRYVRLWWPFADLR